MFPGWAFLPVATLGRSWPCVHPFVPRVHREKRAFQGLTLKGLWSPGATAR